MNPRVIAALLALTLAGCATETARLESEKTYQVEWLDGRLPIKHSHLTLVFGADGRAYGNAGCNHWFASYTLANQRLTFGQIGSTRMICSPERMEQEQRFLTLLGNIQRWDGDKEEEPRLWPATGEPIRLIPERD